MTALWSIKHVPKSEAELVVAKTRISDVSNFLFGRSSRRILLLKGPAGSGKAAVLRALCADLGFELAEWDPATAGNGPLSDTFLRFLAQADRYRTLRTDVHQMVCASRPRVTLVRDFPFTLVNQRQNDGFAGSFVERFHSLLNSGSMQRTVFCFNDTFEDFRAYNRLFPARESTSITSITFDGVARTFAQKALDAVLRAEGFDTSVADVAMLAAECGGDLRHAINALQCLVGGQNRSPVAQVAAKRSRGRSGRGKPTPQNCHTSDPNAAPVTESGNTNTRMRSATLGLFHALGRLLYCKRLPPDGFSEGPAKKKARRTASNEPVQLPAQYLTPKSARPPLYYVPEDVLDSANSEPNKVVEWIFTNAPRYFGDVNHLAGFAQHLAEVDAWGASTPWLTSEENVSSMQMDHYAASVQVRSLLDANQHPIQPFPDPCAAPENVDVRGATAFRLVRPIMLDVERRRVQRLDEINVQLDSLGPTALGSMSANQILVTQTLPLAHLMLLHSRGTHPQLARLPHGLMNLMMELTAPIDGDLLRTMLVRNPAPSDNNGCRDGELPAGWSAALPEDPIED